MQELLNLAQRSDKATMLKTAEYFASIGDRERAAVLFQASGAQDRAITVAMGNDDDDEGNAALAKIAANLDSSSNVDPKVLLDLANVRSLQRHCMKCGRLFQFRKRRDEYLSWLSCALRI